MLLYNETKFLLRSWITAATLLWLLAPALVTTDVGIDFETMACSFHTIINTSDDVLLLP